MVLSTVQFARAETACSMADAMLETATIVQSIQADQNSLQYYKNMEALELRAAQLSLPELLPPESIDTFPKESAALFHYLSSVREAIDSARNGYDDHARQKLMGARTVDFAPSLLSLEYYWGCRSDESDTVIDAAARDGDSFYSAAPDTEARSIDNDFAKAVTGTSNAGDSLSSSSPLYGRKAAREAVFAYPAPVGFIVLCILGLVGGYYFRRRAQKYKYREARRYLNTTTDIEINQKTSSAVMVDISMNGTKLKHDGSLRDRKTLKINLDGKWYVGDIMWTNDFYAGVRFKTPISRSTFNSLVKSAMHAPTAQAA